MRLSNQPGLLRGLILSNRFGTMMKDGERGKKGGEDEVETDDDGILKHYHAPQDIRPPTEGLGGTGRRAGVWRVLLCC